MMTGIGRAYRTLEAAWGWLFGPDIFVTYTRRDGEAYARALKEALERHFLVFLDDSSIQGGESISGRIRREIRRCRLHLIVLTPEAMDPLRAPWIFKEVELHVRERRWHAIQTIFFPPNGPHALPERLSKLADYKGISELAGGEHSGSISIQVLAAIAGRESPATIAALWAQAERPVDAIPEIRRGFSAVRQRTRMQQAAATALCLLLARACGASWAGYASRKRLELVPLAEQAEAGQRFLEAERLWLAAARIAPWARADFRANWMRARENRLLTPAAVVTLPPHWNCLAIGTRADGWCLLVHRLPDNDHTNGRAALVGPNGWLMSIPTEDDFNPRAFFHPEATYLYAAGKVTRIDSAVSERRIETNIGGQSYRLASIYPQIELGWKANKLCILAGLERPPVVIMLDPTTLRLESRTKLKLPIDLAPPDTGPNGSDRFGEAILRLSTRDDRVAIALWMRFTEYKVGVISWDLALQAHTAERDFDLPMTDIGPGSGPNLETIELSPGDQQLFLNIGVINFSGDAPTRAGQNFWIALDTASNRPPYLLESLISKLWPLPAHQQYEAYYIVDGNDLRGLTFLDFVVKSRPSVGVLRDVRDAALLPLPVSSPPTLAAATARDIALIRAAAPIFRIAAPQPDPAAPRRLDHVFADPAGSWLAAAFEIDSETTPQRVVIWKTGVPAPTGGLPSEQELVRETQATELILPSMP